AVDALVVGEHASVTDAVVHLAARDPLDLENDLAVVEKQHVAGLHVTRQLLVVQADAPVFAELTIGVEHESIARGERDLAFLEFGGAYLRALKVPHDSPGAAGLAARLAHQFRAALVIGGRAVRKIQPHDVHSGEEHALERLWIARSGAKRGDDFGASAHQTSGETGLLNFGIRGPVSAIFPVLPRLGP